MQPTGMYARAAVPVLVSLVFSCLNMIKYSVSSGTDTLVDDPLTLSEVHNERLKSVGVATELTHKTFNRFIKNEELTYVFFYAPWCPHCKKLLPEFDDAAKLLAENSPPIKLGRVNVDAEEKLVEMYGITMLPGLLLFRKGAIYSPEIPAGMAPTDGKGIVKLLQLLTSPDWSEPKNPVITLTEKNFDTVAKQEDLLLVKFAVSWGEQCMKLYRPYKEAAKLMQLAGSRVQFAEVDADSEKGLVARFGIKDFPQLMYFRRGFARVYDGVYETETQIVDYMVQQSKLGSKEVTEFAQVKSALENNTKPNNGVVLVGLFYAKPGTTPASKAWRLFVAVNEYLRDEFEFVHSMSPRLRAHFSVPPNTLLVLKSPEMTTKYEDAQYVVNLDSYIHGESEFNPSSEAVTNVARSLYHQGLPLVGTCTRANFKSKYSDRRRLRVFVFTDFNTSSSDYLSDIRATRNVIAYVAERYAPTIQFALGDKNDAIDVVQELGLTGMKRVGVGMYGLNDEKYSMLRKENYTESSVGAFVQAVVSGKREQHLKSQSPPSKLEQRKTPVKMLIGKTFKKVVFSPKHDVLVELYAPWCGHCQKLHPKYRKLAKNLWKIKTLVIANIDATANDVPYTYRNRGYPTIYFAPKHYKDNPIKYEGPHEVANLTAFLKENGVDIPNFFSEPVFKSSSKSTARTKRRRTESRTNEDPVSTSDPNFWSKSTNGDPSSTTGRPPERPPSPPVTSPAMYAKTKLETESADISPGKAGHAVAKSQSSGESGDDDSDKACDKPVRSWSPGDVQSWLREIKASASVIQRAAEEVVDGVTLVEMEKSDWIEIGATGIKATRLMAHAKALKH